MVTGGAGFIGSHLVEQLISRGATVFVADTTINPLSYFAKQQLKKKVNYFDCDIRNLKAFSTIVTKNQINGIYHLAATSEVGVGLKSPREALEVNIMGTVNVLECLRLNKNIQWVVIASSDKAYGNLSKKKYLESDCLRGDYPYDVSKSTADLIAQSYHKTFGLPIAVTRFGNVYGEGDFHLSRLIPGIMKALIENHEFVIRSDGEYVRDYLYVGDVVAGYLSLIENIKQVKGRAYNFGSNETLSVFEVIKAIEKQLNKKVRYQVLNEAKQEIPYQSLDWSKITQDTSWKPVFSLNTTIKKIFDWYRTNLKS